MNSLFSRFTFVCTGILILVALVISCGGGGGGSNNAPTSLLQVAQAGSDGNIIRLEIQGPASVTLKKGDIQSWSMRAFATLLQPDRSYREEEISEVSGFSFRIEPKPTTGDGKLFSVSGNGSGNVEKYRIRGAISQTDLLTYVSSRFPANSSVGNGSNNNDDGTAIVLGALALLLICPSQSAEVVVTHQLATGGNITPPPVDQKVLTISGPTTLKVGQNGQYTASLSGQIVSASWSATDGSITTSGLFTPASTGQVTVTATASGKTAQLGVTITGNDIPSGDWILLFEGNTFKPGETISLPAPGSAKFTLQNGPTCYLQWDLVAGPSGSATYPLGDPDAGPLTVCQVFFGKSGDYTLRVSEFAAKEDYVTGNSPKKYAEWKIHVG